jgi:uncharacterized protein (TIGR00251 family)
VKLDLKVVPSSSRDTVVGWLGEALKIKVRAAPEKGRANAAVEALLCQTLALPKGSVTITAGHSSGSKTAEIQGLSRDALCQKLRAAGVA